MGKELPGRHRETALHIVCHPEGILEAKAQGQPGPAAREQAPRLLGHLVVLTPVECLKPASVSFAVTSKSLQPSEYV